MAISRLQAGAADSSASLDALRDPAGNALKARAASDPSSTMVKKISSHAPTSDARKIAATRRPKIGSKMARRRPADASRTTITGETTSSRMGSAARCSALKANSGWIGRRRRLDSEPSRMAVLSSHTIQALLQTLPVADLAIEDPPLEEVMRELFQEVRTASASATATATATATAASTATKQAG